MIDLFFGELKYLKSTFTFWESMKNQTPAPDFPIGLFPLFVTLFLEDFPKLQRRNRHIFPRMQI